MYYFIISPDARKEIGKRAWKEIVRRVERSGIRYQVHMAAGLGDVERFTAELTGGSREPHTIVAVGGDSLLGEILNGLSFDGQVTLGYIPTTPGNDLARSLKLPANPVKCAEKILYPKEHRYLDYGILDYVADKPVYRRFLVSSGIGMDTALCEESRPQKRMCGFRPARARRILPGIRGLMGAAPVKGYVMLDGVRKVEFNHIYFISAQIHAFEGDGFCFAPSADWGDGMLELCVAHASSKRDLGKMLLDALLGCSGRSRGVHRYRCRDAFIHVERPMPVHQDGSRCEDQTEIHWSCVQKKLRMIV